jgi:hypothetical protein
MPNNEQERAERVIPRRVIMMAARPVPRRRGPDPELMRHRDDLMARRQAWHERFPPTDLEVPAPPVRTFVIRSCQCLFDLGHPVDIPALGRAEPERGLIDTHPPDHFSFRFYEQPHFRITVNARGKATVHGSGDEAQHRAVWERFWTEVLRPFLEDSEVEAPRPE